MTTRPHPVTGEAFATPVPPGSGWPDDPADAGTRVARSAVGVRRLAASSDLATLSARVSVCAACPRLVDWRESQAAATRPAYAGEPYWGRPVPGFGDETPRILVVGLAPAAHGANRTGRNFTGDRSGDWLYAGLHRAGLAAQPTSEHAGDGQALRHTRIVAAVRCAPPDNRPTPAERNACAPWLDRELALVRPGLRVVLCLGALGWGAALGALLAAGVPLPTPRPRFGHGAEIPLADDLTLLGCYHPSPHNTQTGRLTEEMLDRVLARARLLAGLAPYAPPVPGGAPR